MINEQLCILVAIAAAAAATAHRAKMQLLCKYKFGVEHTVRVISKGQQHQQHYDMA
jgi:hypothetical protein